MLKGFIQTKTATDFPFSQEQNKTGKTALTKIKQKHCKHFKITKTSQKTQEATFQHTVKVIRTVKRGGAALRQQ